MIAYFIIIVTIVIDKIIKSFMISFLQDYPFGYNIIPIFKLLLIKNTGISFSILDTTNKWILISISIIITIFLTIWLYKTKQQTSRIGFSLIIGGAIGNIIDRIQYDGVIDFIHIYYKEYYLPTFNTADIFIFLGVCILLFNDAFTKKNNHI